MMSAHDGNVLLADLLRGLQAPADDKNPSDFLAAARRLVADHPIAVGSEGIRSAGIYLRISFDKKAHALGVQRQLVHAVEVCERRGWGVGAIYCDNDVSAYKVDVVRPEYERLCDDIRVGNRDAVACYHSDRLHRQPKQFEEFKLMCNLAGLRYVASPEEGVFDLGNEEAMLMPRIRAAINAQESARKSKRMKDAQAQRAQLGIPHNSRRGFGYRSDMTVHEQEADVIRTMMVIPFLAGSTVASITRNLVAAGVPTVQGAAWRTVTVSGILRSARIAGLREYCGDVVGSGHWDAIITGAERDRILALFESRKQTGRRTPRRYELSGMVRCGREWPSESASGSRCMNRLFAHLRYGASGNIRRYVCTSGVDHDGCGRLSVTAQPLEELVSTAAFRALDSAELKQS